MSLTLVVLLPFIGALFPALMLRAGRNACALATFIFSLLALAILGAHAPAVLRGEVVSVAWDWVPALGLQFAFFLDGLGLFFAALILAIGLLIIVYARFYLAKDDPMGVFYTCLLLFQGAMVGVVLSDNVLLLLVFWELTSLSSFLLIGYWRHLPAGRQGARMALAVTGAGGLAMVAGMLILGDIAGSYRLTDILAARAQIQASPLYLPALLLILAGCFTKSAQFPFHFWLPHAMAAPTPVSAYLHSATMVKAGIFLLARLWPVLAGTPEWFYLVATTGAVTMLLGAAIALFKDDLKAVLAYSTVSHLGLVTMLLGFGTPLAAVAAVFHILNHASFKAALFMNAGIIDHETGTRDIRRLGGLLQLMPLSATLGMVAAASMAGLPLLNGFLSKEMMLEQTLATPWAGVTWLLPALATLAAALAVGYSLRYGVQVFLGPRREPDAAPAHDPPAGMWLPGAVLVVAVVLIGLWPETFAGALVRLTAAAVIGGGVPPFELALWHGPTPALGLSVLALLAGGALLWRYAGVRAAWQAGPHPDAKALFDSALGALLQLCQRLTHGAHNGALQRYVACTVAAIAGAGFIAFFAAPHAAGTRALLPANPVAVVAWVVLAGGCALALALRRERLLAVVAVGIVGLIVCLAFIYLSAPDLALTQIAVEVATVILMLLALYFLPKRDPQGDDAARGCGRLRLWRDGLLAGLAGVGMTAASWAVMTRDGESLSRYYLDNAVTGGGGANVVNVILVDFRGFDTFGEITVLGIAGLAIYAMLDGALHGRIGRRLSAWVPDMAVAADRHPLMMVVITRAMLPLALLVGAFIFLRGHNQPGGGFIAALVVSIALIMQYMASGFGWAAQRVRVDYHAMIGAGVLVAAGTGIGAMVLGKPFLTSAFDHFHLPLLGELELASAIAFDAGVFLTVVGAVMLVLANLARIGRRAGHLPINKGPMDFDPGAVRRRVR